MANLQDSEVISKNNERQLADLHHKKATHTTALHNLETQRTTLLHHLNTLLPPLTQQTLLNTSYTPSTAAHSTPSNHPHFSPQSNEHLNNEAKAILKQHITALHRYNEIKDVAQGLMGMIAEARGVRVRDLYVDGEFGVGEGD